MFYAFGQNGVKLTDMLYVFGLIAVIKTQENIVNVHVKNRELAETKREVFELK